MTETAAAREVLLSAPTCWAPAVLDERPGWWRLGIDGEVVRVRVEVGIDRPRRITRGLWVAPDRARSWSEFAGSLTLHLPSPAQRAATLELLGTVEPVRPFLAPVARRRAGSTFGRLLDTVVEHIGTHASRPTQPVLPPGHCPARRS